MGILRDGYFSLGQSDALAIFFPFRSPAGMIEGTPQLHANAWKVSSACHVPVNVPVVDPCNINQQNGALLVWGFHIITLFNYSSYSGVQALVFLGDVLDILMSSIL